MPTDALTRRDILRSGAAAAAAGLAAAPAAATAKAPKGRATAGIMLWLGGRAAQVDTFDPKRRGDGKKQAGSYYDAIPTAVRGETVGEHLPRVADRLDRCVLVRSLHHQIIDEHAAATNLVHTGRPT